MGLGTAFRGQWDDEVCARIVDQALGLGVNFIDTANVYGEDRVGHAERVLGSVLKGRRDEVVLATKIFHPVGPGLNNRGLSRVHLMREIDQCLRRLETDYVDILYLHEPDPDTALDEALRAGEAIVRQGKARYIGLSRFSAWQCAQALGIATQFNLDPVVVIQARYNLIYREAELELLPFVRASEMALTVFSPLAIGLLSGRFRSDQPPPGDTPWGRGYTGFEQLMTRQTDLLVEALREMSERYGKTPAQIAIAWLLAHPEVTSVIIGPDTPEQVTEDVGGNDIELDAEDIDRLNELSAPTWAMRP